MIYSEATVHPHDLSYLLGSFFLSDTTVGSLQVGAMFLSLRNHVWSSAPFRAPQLQLRKHFVFLFIINQHVHK